MLEHWNGGASMKGKKWDRKKEWKIKFQCGNRTCDLIVCSRPSLPHSYRLKDCTKPTHQHIPQKLRVAALAPPIIMHSGTLYSSGHHWGMKFCPYRGVDLCQAGVNLYHKNAFGTQQSGLYWGVPSHQAGWPLWGVPLYYAFSASHLSASPPCTLPVGGGTRGATPPHISNH